MDHARVEFVDDAEDPRIAPFRAVRERDLVGRDGLFIAEGEVVLRLLSRAPRHRARAVLIASHRLDSRADLIAAFRPEVRIFAANQAVMDAIVGFPIHRGLLALGERAEPLDAETLLSSLPARALVLVASGIGNHDNMGGLFRNAAAFGVDAVVLDAGCCDPLYRKAIRVSVGAALTMPCARLEPGADLADLLARTGFEGLALSPGGAMRLTDVRKPDRAAVIVGAEGPGLPADLMARLKTVRIPMAAGIDSLNVAVASAIVLHHLAAAGEAG